MINKQLAKLILNEGLSTGADFSELYFEETYTHSINFDNGIVESIGSNNSTGVGIRLLKNNRSVYGYTNEIDKENLLKLVKKLRSAFSSKRKIKCKDFKDKKVTNINENDESYFLTPINKRIEILDKLTKIIKKESKLINRTVCAFAGDKKSIEIFNSEGLHIKDKKEHTRLIIQAFSVKGDKHEMALNVPGTTGSMNYFTKKINLEKIAKDVAKDAVEALNAKDCPSGKMPVVIGNGVGGVLFHEACGHSLEACAVSKNLSTFTPNRLNTKIASSLVTAYDDGTIKGRWGTNNIDDEGNKTTRNCLIKNGILKNYMVDRFYGRRMKRDANGSCRRQSYKFEPTTRMSNTYIDNGKSTPEEIIKSTKLGLYAKRLGGGSVNPITGQFEFSCSTAYIIRNGKICERVKGATLIGTGEEILKNIDMVGNDLDMDTGYCGSASGWVPVATGQPTLRVKEITVGGSGGKIQ